MADTSPPRALHLPGTPSRLAMPTSVTTRAILPKVAKSITHYGDWRACNAGNARSEREKADAFLSGYGELFAIYNDARSHRLMPNYLWFVVEMGETILKSLALVALDDPTAQEALVITLEAGSLALFLIQRPFTDKTMMNVDVAVIKSFSLVSFITLGVSADPIRSRGHPLQPGRIVLADCASGGSTASPHPGHHIQNIRCAVRNHTMLRRLAPALQARRPEPSQAGQQGRACGAARYDGANRSGGFQERVEARDLATESVDSLRAHHRRTNGGSRDKRGGARESGRGCADDCICACRRQSAPNAGAKAAVPWVGVG
mmetsp:Transcript_45249/g.112480  ORF Transcript_45249/g.112480 Transcript_45249/m.112480 type:complete len:317 (-) Transcript_45249:1079-2029(-)